MGTGPCLPAQQLEGHSASRLQKSSNTSHSLSEREENESAAEAPGRTTEFAVSRAKGRSMGSVTTVPLPPAVSKLQPHTVVLDFTSSAQVLNP